MKNEYTWDEDICENSHEPIQNETDSNLTLDSLSNDHNESGLFSSSILDTISCEINPKKRRSIYTTHSHPCSYNTNLIRQNKPH